jgi:CheY-like chemotaxis protein
MSNPLILLVDQSKFFLEIQKGFLKNTEARILCAGSSREALDCLRRQPADLVYLALELAGEDGAHCCRAIKTDPELQQIPVVMLYDAGAPGDRERCLQAACDGVLSRPLERRSFLDEGRKFLFKVERREPRVPCQALVVFRYNGESSYGTSQDLSPGGIFISTSVRARLGDRVSLSLVLPGRGDQLIEVSGRIAWLNPGPITQSRDFPQGFGVEFLDFGPGCASLLHRYLQQVGGAAAQV